MPQGNKINFAIRPNSRFLILIFICKTGNRNIDWMYFHCNRIKKWPIFIWICGKLLVLFVWFYFRKVLLTKYKFNVSTEMFSKFLLDFKHANLYFMLSIHHLFLFSFIESKSMNRQMQQSLFSCKFNIGKGYYFFLSRQHNTNVYAIEHFQLKRRENFLRIFFSNIPSLTFEPQSSTILTFLHSSYFNINK